MKRLLVPIIIGVAAGAMIAIIGPYLVVGRLPYTEAIFLCALFLGTPAALISLSLLFFSRFRATKFPGIGLGITACLLVSLLGTSHADQLKRVHNRRAREYCESLIPELEEYHSTHGTYPDSINDLRKAELPPISVYLSRRYYWNETNKFSFGWFDSPGFPMCTGGTYYSFATRHWGGCADW